MFMLVCFSAILVISCFSFVSFLRDFGGGDPRFLFFKRSSKLLWYWSPFNYAIVANRMLWITVVLAQLVTIDWDVDRVKVAWRGWWTLVSFRISFFFFLIFDTSSWRINYMIYPPYLAAFDWDNDSRIFLEISTSRTFDYFIIKILIIFD